MTYRFQTRVDRSVTPCRSGSTLAEVVVSTFLVGLLLIAALSSVGAAARSWIGAAESADAHALARQLLDEIMTQRYQDETSPVFGPETGEASLPGIRSNLDDVDDYRDWNDTPPRDRNGLAIPQSAGWARVADIQKIDSSDRRTLPDSANSEGIVLITVTVTPPLGQAVTLSAYRSDIGGGLQPQGVPQTLVTWVGVSLQAGSGEPISSGVSLLNHASDL